MPKNKTQHNGLSVYVREVIKPQFEREGRNFSMPIGIAYAHPLYQALPKEQKIFFENRAKELKAASRGQPLNLQFQAVDSRRDTIGNLISERKDEVAEMNKMRIRDKKTLEAEFHALGSNLVDKKFYFIGAQYMVVLEDGEYLPCEIGLVEWSMTNGVSKEYHTFVNPGDVPIGYRYKAQAHSEEYHRIPVEQIKDGTTDYRNVYVSIERFINPKNYDKMPPVFCMLEDYKAVEGCLQFLHTHSRLGRQNYIKVNILEDLTELLFAQKGQNVSSSSVIDMLSTSAFDYESNTKCEFHKDTEAKYCALGCPKKHTYALSDALVPFYDFKLTSNHLPVFDPKYNSNVSYEPYPEENVYNSSQMMPPVGRGTTCETNLTFTGNSKFPARDIRYFPPNKSSAVGNDLETRDEFSDEDELEDKYSSIGYASRNESKFANTLFQPPSASMLPTPDPALFRAPVEQRPTLSGIVQAKRLADDMNQMALVEPPASNSYAVGGYPKGPSSVVSSTLTDMIKERNAKSIISSGIDDTTEICSNWDQLSTISTLSRATQPPPMIGGIGRGRGFRVPEQPPIDPVNTWIAGIGRGRGNIDNDSAVPPGSQAPKNRLPPGFEGYGRGAPTDSHELCLQTRRFSP